jgi:hypothetical protein
MGLRKLFEENLILSLPNFSMCWKKNHKREEKENIKKQIEKLKIFSQKGKRILIWPFILGQPCASPIQQGSLKFWKI